MARKIVGRVLVAPTSEDDGERMHGAINVPGRARDIRRQTNNKFSMLYLHKYWTSCSIL